MIGLFDSGLGGLSVLKELREHAPDADIVYFGDIKHSPYGDRDRAELGALTALGFQTLVSHGADKIVTACNSVSILLMKSMLDILALEEQNVIEMVHPTVEFCKEKGFKKVLLLATQATVQSGMYQRGLEHAGIGTQAFALSGLVDLIDTGASEESIEQHIHDFREQIDYELPDALILGCTHFPLVRNEFEKVFGNDTLIVDPAVPVVRVVVQKFDTRGTGKSTFLISRDSEAFRRAVHNYFGTLNSEIRVLK